MVMVESVSMNFSNVSLLPKTPTDTHTAHKPQSSTVLILSFLMIVGVTELGLVKMLML